MGRPRRLPDCTTIGELQNRPELSLVTDSQDVRATKEMIGRRARGYEGFLVYQIEGEIVEAWGFRGNIPLLNKLACRVK